MKRRVNCTYKLGQLCDLVRGTLDVQLEYSCEGYKVIPVVLGEQGRLKTLKNYFCWRGQLTSILESSFDLSWKVPPLTRPLAFFLLLSNVIFY
jgi:hypothetical protein